MDLAGLILLLEISQFVESMDIVLAIHQDLNVPSSRLSAIQSRGVRIRQFRSIHVPTENILHLRREMPWLGLGDDLQPREIVDDGVDSLSDRESVYSILTPTSDRLVANSLISICGVDRLREIFGITNWSSLAEVAPIATRTCSRLSFKGAVVDSSRECLASSEFILRALDNSRHEVLNNYRSDSDSEPTHQSHAADAIPTQRLYGPFLFRDLSTEFQCRDLNCYVNWTAK